MIGRTGALRVPINHSAPRIEAANSMLQARIRAMALLAAPLVRLAVVVSVTLQFHALLRGFALMALGAQANCPVPGDFAQRVHAASGSVQAGIRALSVRAGQCRWAVRVSPTPGETKTLLARIALQK